MIPIGLQMLFGPAKWIVGGPPNNVNDKYKPHELEVNQKGATQKMLEVSQ